jgi:hypothetical protein
LKRAQITQYCKTATAFTKEFAAMQSEEETRAWTSDDEEATQAWIAKAGAKRAAEREKARERMRKKKAEAEAKKKAEAARQDVK